MDKEQFEAGGFCDVCKMAVRYVDGILEQNATQAEIEDAVRKVCNFLPDSVKDEVGQTFRVTLAVNGYRFLHLYLTLAVLPTNDSNSV